MKKVCTKCNIEKETTEFLEKTNSVDGFYNWCKLCSKNYQKEYREKNHEKCLQKSRESYLKNRDKRLASWKENYPKNKEKILQYERQYYLTNIDKIRGKTLLKNYGITVEQFNQMLEQQNSRCAVCNTDVPGGRCNQWCVDHDHKCCPKVKSCGKCIRALLCHSCNTGLGLLKDSIEILDSAKLYLEKWSNINESLSSCCVF
jgi:hypothetical protein